MPTLKMRTAQPPTKFGSAGDEKQSRSRKLDVDTEVLGYVLHGSVWVRLTLGDLAHFGQSAAFARQR